MGFRFRLCLALLVCVAAAAAVDTREPAPKFTATTLDGREFTSQSLEGKVVLVQFWTTWCRFCRRDQPAVDAVFKKFAEKGLVVLAVNVGEPRQTVQDYLARSARSVPVVLEEDTNLVTAFAVRAYPLYILIDREGRLAGKQPGAGGEKALRELLRKAGLGNGD